MFEPILHPVSLTSVEVATDSISGVVHHVSLLLQETLYRFLLAKTDPLRPLLILFHYSLNMEGRRKRRKPNLMNLSSWNLQGYPITLLGTVSHYCHVFAGNYLWWIATLCSLQSSSEPLRFFPVSPLSLLPSLMLAKEGMPEHAIGFSWASLYYWYILQLLQQLAMASCCLGE